MNPFLNKIHENIGLLTAKKQAVFGYLTCLRVSPNYFFFFRKFNYGNIGVINDCLNLISELLFIEKIETPDKTGLELKYIKGGNLIIRSDLQQTTFLIFISEGLLKVTSFWPEDTKAM